MLVQKSADVYHFGALLYLMLTRKFPGKTFVVREGLNSKSEALLRGLLHEDPASRLSMDDVLRHPWMDSAPQANVASQRKEKSEDELELSEEESKVLMKDPDPDPGSRTPSNTTNTTNTTAATETTVSDDLAPPHDPPIPPTFGASEDERKFPQLTEALLRQHEQRCPSPSPIDEMDRCSRLIVRTRTPAPVDAMAAAPNSAAKLWCPEDKAKVSQTEDSHLHATMFGGAPAADGGFGKVLHCERDRNIAAPLHLNAEKIAEYTDGRYELVGPLMGGRSGSTHLCRHTATGQKTVVKCTRTPNAAGSKATKRELPPPPPRAPHLNIIATYDCFRTADGLYSLCVMEHVPGVDLVDAAQRLGRPFFESEARHLCSSILRAINSLRAVGGAQVHRNISEANVRFKFVDIRQPIREWEVKLRLATSDPWPLCTDHPQDTTDSFSLGTLLLLLLTGSRERGEVLGNPPWPRLSLEANDLLAKLLDGDPTDPTDPADRADLPTRRRMGCTDALKHPWFKMSDGGGGGVNPTSGHPHPHPVNLDVETMPPPTTSTPPSMPLDTTAAPPPPPLALPLPLPPPLLATQPDIQ